MACNFQHRYILSDVQQAASGQSLPKIVDVSMVKLEGIEPIVGEPRIRASGLLFLDLERDCRTCFLVSWLTLPAFVAGEAVTRERLIVHLLFSLSPAC